MSFAIKLVGQQSDSFPGQCAPSQRVGQDVAEFLDQKGVHIVVGKHSPVTDKDDPAKLESGFKVSHHFRNGSLVHRVAGEDVVA